MDCEQFHGIAIFGALFGDRVLEFIFWALRRGERKGSSTASVQIKEFEKFRQPSSLRDAFLPPFGSKIPKTNQLDRIVGDVQGGGRSVDDLEQVAGARIPGLGKLMQRAQ